MNWGSGHHIRVGTFIDGCIIFRKYKKIVGLLENSADGGYQFQAPFGCKAIWPPYGVFLLSSLARYFQAVKYGMPYEHGARDWSAPI